MRMMISTCATAAMKRAAEASAALLACAVLSAGPALADQAQTDLAAALAYNQQVAQQQMMQQQQMQQQQTQMQNQQFALGTAGVQPYCNNYGTCPNALAARHAQEAAWAFLFGPGAQATPAADEPGSAPRAPAHHRRRHHRTAH